MADLADLELKQAEYKTATFTLTDRDDDPADVSSATLTLTCKKVGAKDVSFTVADGDMDKTDAADGIVVITFTETATALAGDYEMELKAVYSATHIVKSDDLTLKITRALDV